MVQPLVRNGMILPNEQQPIEYLLAYMDALLDQVARQLDGVKAPFDATSTLGQDIKSAHVHLNVIRDIVHVLQQRESYKDGNDGGYK